MAQTLFPQGANIFTDDDDTLYKAKTGHKDDTKLANVH